MNPLIPARAAYDRGASFPGCKLMVLNARIYIISTTWERPSVPIIGFLRSLYAVLGGAEAETDDVCKNMQYSGKRQNPSSE